MLNVDAAALVIIDVQGNLAQAMSQKEQLFDNLRKLIEGVKVLELPIIWAEQLPEKLGPTIPQVSELLAGHAPIAKNTFSCCGDGRFAAAVEESGRTAFLVVGIETHVCVHQTVMDLLGRGLEVHLVADATSSRTQENKQIGIDRMRSAGAHITSVEMALFELLRVAEGGRFKKILKIVK